MAQLLAVLSTWSGQSLIDECEQYGGQSALEADRRFGTVTQVIVINREQIPLLVEMLTPVATPRPVVDGRSYRDRRPGQEALGRGHRPGIE